MALNQVGQNVTNQLSKQLDIDATGLLTPNMLIPAPMVTPPLQTNFGSYQLGYSPFIPPPTMAQVIPAAPPAGASSPHHYQALSDQNLHPLLFQIEPHPDLFAHVHVPLVIDQHTQQPVFGRDPNRQLRFFSFLPHWINVNVRGELLELWFRLDSRLQLSDITDRINVPATQKIPNAGAFNMRRNRFRALINVPVYSQSRNRPLKADVELLGQMSREQVLLNTSMLVDVNNGMLLKPVVRTGQVASFVDSGLPLDYFITAFLPQPISIPSDRQLVAILLRRRLQFLASYHGLGNLATNFLQLADADLPSWWVRPAPAPRAIHEIDGLTHGEFVDNLVGVTPTAVVTAAAPPPVRPRARRVRAGRRQRRG